MTQEKNYEYLPLLLDAVANLFERHVVTQELNQGLFRSWRCANPDSGVYWFRVVTWPGSFYVGGDISDFVFSGRQPDMIEWAKRAIKDPRYMAEKVVAGTPFKFSEERLRAWLEEYAKELTDEATLEMRNDIECLLENGAVTIADAYEIGIDEVPSCEALTEQYLTAIAALSWFLQKVKTS